MFMRAQPVWLAGREKEMNVYVVARCTLNRGDHFVLHISGTAFYRAWADGRFLAFGPARTAEGHVREDEIPLPEGTREVLLELVGYYCHSLATVWQPSFFMAEIRSGTEVLFATSRDTVLYAPPHKVQKTERYSVQRHFTEVWDERFGDRTEEQYRGITAVIDPAPAVLPRRAPYPVYQDMSVHVAVCRGELTYDSSLPCKKMRYSWSNVPQGWGVFPWQDIPYHPHAWIQQQRQTVKERSVSMPITLWDGAYALFDLGQIEAGFLRAELDCLKETDLIIAFAEHCEDAAKDTFAYPNMNVHNAVEWLLPAGGRELLSFEPYTCRIALIAVKSGCVTLRSFGVRSCALDRTAYPSPVLKNDILTKIYHAAVRNYTHNAIDLYMDCPARERAGWLNDAFFTARAEYALTGQCKTEEAYLENIRLFVNHGEYPEGALPEAYPSDAPPLDTNDPEVDQPLSGVFIPQCGLWFLLELEEYLLRRGHESEKPLFRNTVDALMSFFQRYENSDGLLERLPMWNFVEWGRANDWTKDVNYPTNFLYAEALERMGRVYQEEAWVRRSREVRRAALEQSFDGQCFRDHAVRMEDGTLAVQPDRSEAGQYYAALFGGIDLDAPPYRELRRLILEVFSPERKDDDSGIIPFEMIPGGYLRLTLLSCMKQWDLLLRDIQTIFGPMAAENGTLWEYRSGKGSRDHGLCSYVAALILAAQAGSLADRSMLY